MNHSVRLDGVVHAATMDSGLCAGMTLCKRVWTDFALDDRELPVECLACVAGLAEPRTRDGRVYPIGSKEAVEWLTLRPPTSTSRSK